MVLNMKELTKKVVILNNFSSPYVSQAIVVLKDYNPRLEGKAIEDAEMIVSKYIDKINGGQSVKTARRKNKLIKIIICAAVIIAICAAVKYIK